MKFKIFFILSFLGIGLCYAEGDITTCNELESNQNASYSTPLNDPKKDPVNFCDETVYHVGKKRLSKEEVQELKNREKHLRSECKKKAKAYKRAVAKSLFKDFKLKQGLEALFKSKKKLMKTTLVNGKLKRNQKEILGSLSPEELELLQSGLISKEEFSEIVIAQIRKEIPNIDELVKEAGQLNNYSKGFHQKEIYPINLVIKTEAGKSCVLKMDDFPEEKVFTPKTCELCKPEIIQNNFTNDCAYMVNAEFSEKEARKLVGASSIKDNGVREDSHCNHDMKGIENDMTEINKTVQKLCNIAKEGLVPEFNIETSRNEYNDKTNDLALKRGEFTRKYIFSMLKKKNGPCKFEEGEELPDWLESEEEFSKVVTISSPYYQRPGAVAGNYGPKPDAQGSEIEKEKEYLENTLIYEIKVLNAKVKEYKKRITEIEGELVTIEDSVKENEKLFAKTKTSNINGTSVIDGVNDKTLRLTNIASETQELYIQKRKLLQEKSDLEVKINGLEQEKNSQKYSTNEEGAFNLVTKLDAFYKGDRTNREKWDKELFNQFKMARITGDISKKNDFGFDENLMTPQLNAMLKTLVQVDNFVCELKPLETRKVSLEGVLKMPLKIVTAATLPVAGVVGAIGGAFNWMCRGCLTPGNQPPKISFRFKENMPSVVRDLKDATRSYVTWGGKLSVNKRKYTTKHDLKDYSTVRYGETKTRSEGCVDSPMSKEFNRGQNSPTGSEVNVNVE